MPNPPKQRRRTSNSTAQLALPGLEAPAAPQPFDIFSLVRETFRRWAPDGDMPAIQVSRRMLRTLGSFTPSRNLIRLSSRLLALGTPDEQREVALHEVAHAIVHQRDPKARAHGREFRSACKDLGLAAGRFVNIDHAGWNRRLRYSVDCPSCGEKILRKKRTSRVKCDCGAALRPKRWSAVALSDDGPKPI